MKWKVIRLELASSWRFPRGSAGRSYLIRLPLTEEGRIDAVALQLQPLRATVRRYWPNEPDMLGHLMLTPTGYAIEYELDGSGGPNAKPDENGQEVPRLFEFGADAIKLGGEVSLTEPDGDEGQYRVASLQ